MLVSFQRKGLLSVPNILALKAQNVTPDESTCSDTRDVDEIVKEAIGDYKPVPLAGEF